MSHVTKYQIQQQSKASRIENLRGENALGSRVGALLTPSIIKMPKSGLQKAELVNASHEFFGGGTQAATDFLSDRNSPYTIDEELSKRDHIVATKEDGSVHLAFRGTVGLITLVNRVRCMTYRHGPLFLWE